MNTLPPCPFYNRDQAAMYLGVSPGTLANWHSSKSRRVPYVKIGRYVRYRPKDLEAFIEANVHDRIESTA
jgi:excisionase family DNA binding protein